MKKEIEKLKEIVLKYVPDTIENFDERNKVENLLEDILNDYLSLEKDKDNCDKKISYFLNRFPEFLNKGTQYVEMFHKYDYLD